MIVEVKAENERAHLLDEMQRRFAVAPPGAAVLLRHRRVDFVLIFLVRLMDQYVELTRELFSSRAT